MYLDNFLSNPSIDIEKNWKTLRREFLSVKRDGIDALWKFIEEKTDFKTAPASTKFHMNAKGGLVEHTLNVLRFTRENQRMLEVPGVDDDSITISALLHDLCKVNYYLEGEEWDKEYKDKYNEWRKKKVWKVEDQIPLGHGEKSVIMAVRYIPLSLAEMAAIRWHMAWSDQGVHSFYPSGAPFKESLDRYPLLKLLMLGDAQAELKESYSYETAKSNV